MHFVRHRQPLCASPQASCNQVSVLGFDDVVGVAGAVVSEEGCSPARLVLSGSKIRLTKLGL